ncbi:MAG: UvrD-helicase domain-containing protein [Deltaproteobacteria bacterium]|nr:UvrD-helicase domain-containing protein [Deltaproteobacteria bacterium]
MNRLPPTDPKVRVVTAPAGSGKTTVLLQRYLGLLQDDVPAHRIVAITFTRKAAAEMVERLARLLDAAAGRSKLNAKQQKLYGPFLPKAETADGALRQLDALPVCTVDAFILSLMREFALQAHFVLGDGSKVWIDGPVEVSGDTSAAYQQAAREALDELSDPARVLLRHLTLGQAVDDLAALAAVQVPGLWRSAPRSKVAPASATTATKLLDGLGKALAREVKHDPDEWVTRICARTRGKELTGPAADWIRNPVGRPSAEALHCLAKLKPEDEPSARRNKALNETLESIGLRDMRADEWAWSSWASKAKMWPWFDGGDLDRAAEVQRAFGQLVPQVRDGALRLIAREGRLGYEELLAAATALCRDDSLAGLRARFDALLVDELQDTNPAQLAFYEAFEQMRGGPKGIRAFFVGDGRQSIYRFRGADPYGWFELVKGAKRNGTWTWLETNYRSTKLLVTAQRVAFGHLVENGETGVDALPDTLKEGPDAKPGRLESKDRPAPVVVIDAEEKPDRLALVVFAERVREQWALHPDQTAAVLVRSWAKGADAVRVLRDHGVPAQLTGDRALLGSRGAADVRLFLRALTDLTDDIALVGMLKHPSVGVSDRGLMLLRAGGGFGRIFVPEVDLSQLEEGDRARLEVVLPILRAARRRLGREPTADVLEWLAAQLAWRPIVAAGPEWEDGAALARLEILFEVIRVLESNGVDPRAVVEGLEPGDDPSDDLPVVRLHGGAGVVTVTTYWGAKGLEFDHVALLQVNKEGDRGVKGENAWVVATPRGQPVLGTRVDPAGGLEPAADPLAMLGAALCDRESREEGLRMFYVGFTRAKRSVTFGLEKASRDSNPLKNALREVYIENSRLGPAVQVVQADQVKQKPATLRLRKPLGRVANPLVEWAEPRGLVMARATSAEEAGLPVEEIEKSYRDRAKIVVGESGPTRPALSGFDGVPAATWGEVVHGWLATWGFAGDPTIEAATAYLKTEWSTTQPVLAKWLVGAGLAVRDGLDGFQDLLKGRPHFERPVLGTDGTTLWTGRPDLVIEFPDRHVVVVDFKAGDKFATPANIPDFGQYAVQLETYRRVLEAAGYRVDEVGLLYVSGPSWVRVPPELGRSNGGGGASMEPRAVMTATTRGDAHGG